MAIKNTTTIKLERENIAGEYGEGWQYVWLGDGDRISIEVGDDLDEVIAFLIRVRAMQDDDRPSGTCVYAGTQRDYGDETPEDDGFITAHPRPRRDGPGLDVKALADLEGRN
jgi:hypothetical protein